LSEFMVPNQDFKLEQLVVWTDEDLHHMCDLGFIQQASRGAQAAFWVLIEALSGIEDSASHLCAVTHTICSFLAYRVRLGREQPQHHGSRQAAH
jgi:hypothetical protein